MASGEAWKGLIQPVNRQSWWRFRVPGYGSVNWKGFFSVLSEVAYMGAVNIEHEDNFYYPAYANGDLRISTSVGSVLRMSI